MNKHAALIGAPIFRTIRDLSVDLFRKAFSSLEAKHHAGQRWVWEIKPRNLRALCSRPPPPFHRKTCWRLSLFGRSWQSARVSIENRGVSRNFFSPRRQMTAWRAAKFNCVYGSVNWRGIFAGYRYANQNVILLTHCAPICTSKRPGNAKPLPITRKKYLALRIERFSHFFRNDFSMRPNVETCKRYFNYQRVPK